MSKSAPDGNRRSAGIAMICALITTMLIIVIREVSLAGLVGLAYVGLAHLLPGSMGCAYCALRTLSAGGWWGRLTLAVTGVSIMWFALFLGVATHFDAWQGMPDPPPEAFADGAQLTACMLIGWFPGALLYGFALAAAWGLRQVRRGGA
jgi:hypothetical protein